MKVRALLAVAALATSLAAAPLAAQGLTGTWELTAEGGRGAQAFTLELVASGETLTGTVTLAAGGGRGGGGGGGGTMTVDITDGSVSGSDFSFAIVRDQRGNSVTMRYSGSIDGDEMEGTIEGGRGGGQPFAGTRAGQ